MMVHHKGRIIADYDIFPACSRIWQVIDPNAQPTVRKAFELLTTAIQFFIIFVDVQFHWLTRLSSLHSFSSRSSHFDRKLVSHKMLYWRIRYGDTRTFATSMLVCAERTVASKREF